MCGRYSINLSYDQIQQIFGVFLAQGVFEARFNSAPTQELPVITNESPKELSFLKWGLIPSWAKDASMASNMINARSETILEKPSFRTAYRKQRCLVIADGYYEWKKDGKAKIPYRIKLTKDEPFTMAGIWESWRNPEQQLIKTFSIITIEANEKLNAVHHRMPVIIEKETRDLWLSKNSSIEQVNDLLKAKPSEDFMFYQVSTKVNSPFNESPDLLEAV